MQLVTKKIAPFPHSFCCQSWREKICNAFTLILFPSPWEVPVYLKVSVLQLYKCACWFLLQEENDVRSTGSKHQDLLFDLSNSDCDSRGNSKAFCRLLVEEMTRISTEIKSVHSKLDVQKACLLILFIWMQHFPLKILRPDENNQLSGISLPGWSRMHQDISTSYFSQEVTL